MLDLESENEKTFVSKGSDINFLPCNIEMEL